MSIKKQLTVFLENKPGQLSKVCGALGKAKVNILALSVVDSVDTGAVRIVAEAHVEARNALNQLGLIVHSKDVLTVNLPNEPGALASVTTKLAEAGINIDYAYGSVFPGGEESMCILGVSDPRKAEEVLRS